MPAFTYVAIDANGKSQRGVIEADAARQARAGLRSRGLVPVELAPVDAESSARSRVWRRSRGIGAGELVVLTRRFAGLLEAGLTIERALDALVEQGEGGPSSRVLAAVRAEVRAGHSLASALEQHPASFPEFYRGLVATGERAGELAQLMARLADYLDRRQSLRHSAGLALVYPAIVVGVALVVVAGLLAYVIPQVLHVFEQGRYALPLLTRALLWTSRIFADYGLLFAGGLVVVAFLARAGYRKPAVRDRVHDALLRMPLAGTLWRGIDTARFSETLAILVESGVPLVPALGVAARVMSNTALRAAVDDAARRVQEGEALHRALARSRRLPAIFLHIVASGEAGGRLAHALAQAGRQQASENEVRIRLLTGFLEPATIVCMAVLVLVIVLAILMPIIEINQHIRP
ncbi:MAG TPA: type II secretion system inner membrane protein GspF [Burkholderiales bacterium]|nr:type II secretion system inner membrane protein GspF [Burkholderiales bacterium]